MFNWLRDRKENNELKNLLDEKRLELISMIITNHGNGIPIPDKIVFNSGEVSKMGKNLGRTEALADLLAADVWYDYVDNVYYPLYSSVSPKEPKITCTINHVFIESIINLIKIQNENEI